MPEIGTSGSMSGEGKRSNATWLKPPRLSSTLLGLPGFSTRAIPLNCYFFRIPAKGHPVSEESVERKLAAILAADVVGYSRLMAADEAGTVAQLKTHRKRGG